MATGADNQEGTQPGAETPNAEGTQPAANAANAAERTFTQADVDRAVTSRAKREAKRMMDQRLNDLFSELKVDDADHLKELLGNLPDPGAEDKAQRLERKLERLTADLAAEKKARDDERSRHLQTMDDALLSRLAGETSSNPAYFAAGIRSMVTDEHRGETGALDEKKLRALVQDQLAKNPDLAKPTGTRGANSRVGPTGNSAPPKHDLLTAEGRTAALRERLGGEGN
jgi:hypothetical protein